MKMMKICIAFVDFVVVVLLLLFPLNEKLEQTQNGQKVVCQKQTFPQI
jgi:hypothetical protein